LSSKLSIVGGGKVIVEVQLFSNETERLIECGKKKEEKDVEEMKSVGATDGSGHEEGKK